MRKQIQMMCFHFTQMIFQGWKSWWLTQIPNTSFDVSCIGLKIGKLKDGRLPPEHLWKTKLLSKKSMALFLQVASTSNGWVQYIPKSLGCVCWLLYVARSRTARTTCLDIKAFLEMWMLISWLKLGLVVRIIDSSLTRFRVRINPNSQQVNDIQPSIF